jgi:hypothetical protein
MLDDHGTTPGRIRHALASICHHCPLCAYGRRHPESALGRLLRHPWHADHCPFWKAERAAYPPPATENAPPRS